MTVTTPAGLQAVVGGTTLLEDVAVRCRRVWRCNAYGCGWRRACWRTPYYGYYGSPNYGFYGGPTVTVTVGGERLGEARKSSV